MERYYFNEFYCYYGFIYVFLKLEGLYYFVYIIFEATDLLKPFNGKLLIFYLNFLAGSPLDFIKIVFTPVFIVKLKQF